MTIRCYSSTDTGGPGKIGNVAGQLITLLDVVVNGYPVGTVTSITRVGSTVTVLFNAAHGLLPKGNRLTLAGWDQTEYNGEFLVEVPDTTSVTFTCTGTPATPATGGGTVTKAGCSWTKPYTGTNLAAYLQGTGSNGFYLYIDDTGTTSARGIGYETMSSISDTTGAAFPTTALFSGGLHIPKSWNSTTREWILIATETYFYYWINATGTQAASPLSFFGDFTSKKPGDAYNTLFNSGTSSSFTTGNGVAACTASVANALAGHFIPRTAAQTGTCVTAGKHGNSAAIKGATNLGSSGLPYPSVNTGMSLSQIYIHENTIADVRGVLPGVLAPNHNRPLTHMDTYLGTGDFAGNVYLVLDAYSSGQVFVRVE